MRIYTHLMPFGAYKSSGGIQANPGFPTSPVVGPPQQSPLDALSALEQWRVQAEDTNKHSARWSLAQCPLKVFVELHPEQTAEALQQASPQALLGAMRQWEVATQGAIRFTLIAAPKYGPQDADLLIRWDTQTTLGREYEVGHTNRTVQGKRLTYAEITLITRPLIDGHLSPSQRQQRLYTTVLHETGHALGLEHSESAKDVMHHRGWKHPSLSENDIQRIRHLYGLTE